MDWTTDKADWDIRCEHGKRVCNKANVMLRSGLPYSEMVLEFTLKHSATDPSDESSETFMGEVVFVSRHETDKFSEFEMALRYSLLALSTLILWRFWASFRLQGSEGGRIPFGEWQPTQQVTLLLIVANLLYNNPFFLSWVTSGSWYYQLLEMLEASFMVHALIIWALVFVRGMALPDGGTTLPPTAFLPVSALPIIFVVPRWLLDSAHIMMRQYTLFLDDTSQEEDLPTYYVWYYGTLGLKGLICAYALVAFVATFLKLSGDSQVAKKNVLPFAFTVAFLTVTALRADFFDLTDETELGVNQLAAEFISLNVFVMSMAIAFEPSSGAIEAMSLAKAQRQRTANIIRRLAFDKVHESIAPMDLYGSESLVRALTKQHSKRLTIEDETILDSAIRANPLTSKAIVDSGGTLSVDLGADWTSKPTPKLDDSEVITEGQIVTLVRGRATRYPHISVASEKALLLSNLWNGSWLVAGKADLGPSSKVQSDPDSMESSLVNCISDGPCRLNVRIHKDQVPLKKGAFLTVRLVREDGASRYSLVAGLIDPYAAQDMLAKTVAFTTKAVDQEQFAMAAHGDWATLKLEVVAVDRDYDPFENEVELQFPYCIVMKDVTDPALLANAKGSQVVALRQAASRAKAMNKAGDRVEKPTVQSGSPQAFKDLEQELADGSWVDEEPTSFEEQEVKELLSHHFVVKLFHVERPDGKKSVYLMQMKPSALRRETRHFYRERWENEGKRAMSGERSQFYHFDDLANYIDSGKMQVTPAERIELYERLVRKLFHAKSIGYRTLRDGELRLGDQAQAFEDKGDFLEAQLDYDLDRQQQFTPPSFIVYAHPSTLEARDAYQLTPENAPRLPGPGHEKARVVKERARILAAKENGNFVELIEVAFPRHLPTFNHWIENKVKSAKKMTHEDLTILRNHFGEELALYMAFMNKYSQTLYPFAVLGVGMFLLCQVSSHITSTSFTDKYTYLAPFYVLAMVIFSALLQQQWKHENQKLNYLWGVTEYIQADYVRPEFKGERVFNPVKERYEYKYPAWKRWLKQKPLSYFVIFLMVLLLTVITFALYVQLQDALENPDPLYDYDILAWAFNGALPVPLRLVFASALNPLLYAVIVMVGLLTMFNYISHKLCVFENYRTDKEFKDQWTLKMFFFIYVDGYMMFWILSLYHIPLAMYTAFEDLSGISVAGVRLYYKEHQLDAYMDQLAAVCFTAIVVVQVLTYGLENILPFVLKNAETKKKTKERAGLSPHEIHLQKVCDEAERGGFGLFEDWYDVTLFLSYGTVYSLLFPLAPMVNYINNVIEQRTDLSKMIEISRRPDSRKVNNIGMWESCMVFQSYANVLQIALVGVISSYRFDFYLEGLGLVGPVYFETNGDETHVRRFVKLVIVAMAATAGFLVIVTVQRIYGVRDGATTTKLARDDYFERVHTMKLKMGTKVKQFLL